MMSPERERRPRRDGDPDRLTTEIKDQSTAPSPADGHLPPYSTSTEAALVGAVLTWERCHEAVFAAHLGPGDFYTPRFARLWSAILELVGDGEPVDHYTVAARSGDRDAVADALVAAGESCASHAPAWALVVLNHARCRRLLIGMDDAIAAAYAGRYDEAVAALTDQIGEVG